MNFTIDISPAVEESLHQQKGDDAQRVAKEALAVGLYQAERLSIGQVAEFLSTTIYEAEGLMKRQHVAAPYSLEDFERDRETLNRVLKK